MKINKSSYSYILAFSLLFLGFITFSQAQTYLTAAGVRIGNGIGLTVSQRVLDKVTVEGILQNDFNKKTYLHVLGKRHKSVVSRRMNIYYGGGFHVGLQNETESTGIAGVDAILGAEFTIARFNISGDFKPHYTSGVNNGLGLNGAISLRYVLVKDNAIKKIKRKQEKKKKQRQKAKEKSGSEKINLKDIFKKNN